jgi:hypothetical protein
VFGRVAQHTDAIRGSSYIFLTGYFNGAEKTTKIVLLGCWIRFHDVNERIFSVRLSPCYSLHVSLGQ